MNDVIDRVGALHRQLLEDPEYEQYVTAQLWISRDFSCCQ